MYYDYIYLQYGSSGVFYAPAVISESNFDARKGQLFCRYEAILNENDLSGQTIVGGGISIGKSLMSSISANSVNYVKENGKLVINVTLSIENNDKIKFLGEDNEIAKAILGCSPIGMEGYELCVTNDFLSADAENFDLSRIIERKTPILHILAGVFTISAQFNSPIKEVVVLRDGVPLLCFYPQTPLNVRAASVVASASGGVVLNEDDVVDVFSVAVDGNAVLDYHLISEPDKLTYLGNISQKMGKNTRIESGVNDSNLIIDDFGVTLMEKFKPIRWFKGRDGRICANGGVVIFDDKVTIFDGVSEHKLEIKSGIRNEAVFSGGIYLIVCYDGKHVNINRVNASDFSVTSVKEQNGDVEVVKLFNCYIAAITSSVCRVYSVVGTNSSITSWLLGLMGNFAGKKISFYANKLVLFDGVESDYIEYKKIDFIHVAGKICCDFVFKTEGNTTFISSISEPTRILGEISGKIVDVSRHNDRLYITKDDGCVVVHIVNSKKSRLISDAIAQGSQVNYSVRHKLAVAGAVSARINLI